MKPSPSAEERAMMALFIAEPGKREELLQTLCGLVAEFQAQDGCLGSLVASDVAGSPSVLLRVAWRNARAMQRGIASETYRVLLGATHTLSSTGTVSFAAVEALAPAHGTVPGRAHRRTATAPNTP